MKTFIFSTRGGYRKFTVKGICLEDAEHNFEQYPLMARGGFRLKDLPLRYEKKRQMPQIEKQR